MIYACRENSLFQSLVASLALTRLDYCNGIDRSTSHHQTAPTSYLKAANNRDNI